MTDLRRLHADDDHRTRPRRRGHRRRRVGTGYQLDFGWVTCRCWTSGDIRDTSGGHHPPWAVRRRPALAAYRAILGLGNSAGRSHWRSIVHPAAASSSTWAASLPRSLSRSTTPSARSSRCSGQPNTVDHLDERSAPEATSAHRPAPSRETLPILETVEQRITTNIDVSHVIERKRTALHAHASQIGSSLAGKLHTAQFCSAFGTASSIRTP
jgi:hypothetical protein